MTTSTIGRGFAPGSVVVVRDEEWLVTATEQTAGGLLIYGQGLSELVRDTTASFYDTLDDIEALDPQIPSPGTYPAISARFTAATTATP